MKTKNATKPTITKFMEIDNFPDGSAIYIGERRITEKTAKIQFIEKTTNEKIIIHTPPTAVKKNDELNQIPLGPKNFLFLIISLDRNLPQGCIYSQNTLGEKMNRHKRTINRWTRLLEDLTLITIKYLPGIWTNQLKPTTKAYRITKQEKGGYSADKNVAPSTDKVVRQSIGLSINYKRENLINNKNTRREIDPGFKKQFEALMQKKQMQS